MNNRFASILRLGLLFILLAGLALPPQSLAYALTTLTVEPLTWNVIGLDSNNVNVGPNDFPVGARICNTGSEAATNVTAVFKWDSNDSYIDLRQGTLSTLSFGTLGAGPSSCVDAYFEVEVTRDSNAYNHTRRYHIEVTAGNVTGTLSTPTPREVFVEHLVSQSRNAVTDVLLNGASVPAGGTMTLMVGQTYTIKLVGYTATQGYEQIEYFINFPNTIFQILSVSSTFDADTSPTVGPSPINKLYGDNCVWENDPGNPNYRSCLSVGKTGGNVTTTYQVKILQVPGAPLVNPEPLSTLIYDFSGSSFHYNADYGVSTRYAYILDPSAVKINKSFLPDSIIPGGTSTVSIRIPNPTASELTGVNFVDDLPDTAQVPAAPGNMVVAATPNLSYSGCSASSTPTPASLTAGAGSISFSNISIPASGTCIIKFDVTAPTAGTYTNKTGNLFINSTLDTGNFGTANLNVSTTSYACTNGTMARWTVPTTSTNPPDAVGGVPTTRAGNVASATVAATVTAGGTAIKTNSGAPAPNTDTYSWSTYGYQTGGYIQFAVQTKNYSQVSLNLWMYDASPNNGPTQLVISYSTDGTTFTPLTTYNQATPPTPNPFQAAWTNHTFDFTGLTSTTGITYFRVAGSGAKNDNSGASMDYDYMTFTGCSYYPPPTISKTFGTNPILVNGISTLTFTVSNTATTPYNAVNLTGVNFSDTLPAGLEIANPTNASTTCTGGTISAAVAGSTVSLSGASMTAGTSCTVTVNVKGTAAGAYQNVSGYVGSTESGVSKNYATAPLTVIAPPTLTKSFGQTAILLNGTSTMTFTITNPNTTTALTGIGFTDSGAGWPAGLTLATSGPTTVCGGTLSTTSPNSLTFSGGSLAAGANCTFSVTVTGTTAGTKTNTTSTITATGGGLALTGTTGSATLTVNNPVSLIGLNKQISTDNINWYKYIGLTPTQNIWYRFTITNDGETPLNGISVTDPSYNLAGCTPALPASLAVGASASCVLGPISVTTAPTPNPFVNTATVTNTTYTPATPITSTAKYGTKSLAITKNATESYFTAAGNILHYSYTVSNNGGYPLAGPVAVTDDKIGAVSCQDPSAVGDLDSYLDPGESVACPATGTSTYTVQASDVTAGLVTNTAHGSAGGTNSPDTVKSIPLAALTIDKDTTTPSIDINGNVVYTIVVVNTGQIALTNFQVSDVLPAFGGTSKVLSVNAPGYTPPIGPYTGAAPNANLLAGTDTLAVGATATITVTVDLVNATAGTYDNTATATTTQTGSIDDDGLIAGDPGTPGIVADPETDEDVVVYIQPDLTVTKTNNTANGWTTTGGTFQWTITARNGVTAGTASFANTDVILSDTLPAGQTYGAVTVTNGAPAPTGTINCSITGTTLTCVANGPVTMPANASFNVAFNVTAAGTANLSNTATVDPGNKVPESNEGNNTGSNTVSVFDAQPSKLLLTTSEPETSVSRVTIGEMVRYRIAARIPEGSFTNFQLVDNIPSGLQFLHDGTARFAFVSNGAGVTSSTLTCANDTGNAFDLVSLPTANVDCTFTGGITGGTGDGVAVTFSLGNLTNSDPDMDAEYVVVEFNALVLNVNGSVTINQGTNNQTGANVTNNRQNDATLRVNNTTVGVNSANVTVDIAEPAIVNVAKSVSAGPYVPGNAITYMLTFGNVPSTNTNAATAFDIVLTDALDANLTPGTVNVSSTQTSPCIGGTAFTTSNTITGQNVTVNLSCLDPDKTVTVTINATIKAATTGGTNISNTGSVTYTSLPGAQGSCATAPFTCAGLGASGTGTGERNGSNGEGPDTTVLNNYADSAAANFTVQAGTITIVKHTLPAGSTQSFTFTPTYNGGTPFNLTDNGTNASGNIAPGTYTVVESSVAGWSLTGLDCVGYTGNAPVLTLGTRTVQIDLNSAENVICGFTNIKLPTLTLQKTVVNDDGGTALDTAWTLNATYTQRPTTFISGVEGNAAVTNALVFTGDWTLSETGGPAGYTDGAWSCVGAADANPNDGLTLAAGENVTCTITNNDNAPFLTLVKTVTNDNSGTNVATDWTLTATGASGTPTNLSGTTPVASGAGFKADTYTLAETGPAGYTAGTWSCTNGVVVTAGQITLGLDQSTTCTINNNDNVPTITANDDTATTSASTPITTVVTTNDTNVGGTIDPNSVTVTAQPAAGTGSVVCTGASCVYMPPAGYVGTTTYTYQVCLAAPNDLICDTAVVTVTVTPTINAVDDDYTASPINGGSGGTTATVINNDTTNGVAAVIGTNVTLTPDTAPTPAAGSLTMNADGTITVAAGTTAGTYTYPYTICTLPATTPATCDIANATVVVAGATINAVDDTATTPASTPVSTVVTTNDTNVGGTIDPNSVTVTAQPAAGTGSVVCTGASCVYMPPAGYVGTTTYTYQVCLAAPNGSTCDTAVVTVTVTPTINAVDDDYTASPINGGDGGTIASVIVNDATNGVAATIGTNVTLTPGTAPTPAGGSITMNADGTITVGAGTTVGIYTYPYTICTLPATTPVTCDTANATVVVLAPTIMANDDTANTSANTPVTTIVTTNDTNSGGSIDPNSVTVTAQPAAGTGSVICTGASCVYTPPAGYAGTTTYTYQVCLAAPNGLVCDTAVVTVTVTPTINAVNDDYTASPINGGDGGTTASVITNDTTNGVAAVIGTNVTLTPGTAPTPISGLITMNANGTITVTAGTTAGTYTYPYTICTLPATTPATCDTANATVVVTAPTITANDDTTTTAANTPVTTVVTTNDTNVGGSIDPSSVTVTAQPAAGTGSVVCTGASCVYTPPAGYIGTTTYTYSVCLAAPNGSVCDTAVVTVTVTPTINAVDDDYTASPINAGSGGTTASVINNDTTNGVAAVIGTNVTLTPGTAPTPVAGSITMNADGTITVAAGTTAGTYTYPYTICTIPATTPATCDTANATVVVSTATITANDDTATTPANTPATTVVTTNDTNVGGTIDPNSVTVTAQPTPGTGSVVCIGASCVYTPPAGYVGTTTYTYQVCLATPNGSVCDTAVVTVTVTPTINAVDDDYSASPFNGGNGGTTTSVIGNDTTNGVAAVIGTNVTLTPGTAPTPASGSLTMNADGTITVAVGTTAGTYTYPYTICTRPATTPATCDTANATVVVTAPTITANDDVATTPANTPVTTVVTTNDTNVGGTINPNSVTVTAQPAAGTGSVVCTGASCVYTPPAGYVGTTTYTYQVCLAATNAATCDTAIVTVTVAPTINAVDDDYSGSPINGISGGTTPSVIDNDTTNSVAAAIGTNVTITPGSAPTPTAGSITMNPNGTITVAPGTTAGTYIYPYMICTLPATTPATCDTANATVKVGAATIDAVNDDYSSAPIDSSVGGNAGNAFTNDTLNGVAVIPAQITATLVAPASNPGVTLNLGTGSVDVTAGTPAGTYTIVYKICENLNPTNCDTATITVKVNPPASIGGVVFNDANLDGSKAGSETGLAGVTVNLYDSTGATLIDTTTTGPGGTFNFPSLAPGTYRVVEIDPAGYVSSTANSVPVTIAAGTAGVANFGDYQLPNTALSSISGVVFNDANANGTQDASELPLSGVTVELKNNLGTVIGIVVTGASGTYNFPNLSAGTYTVTETDLAGYLSTTLNNVAVNLSAGTNASVNYGDQLSAAVIADPAVTKFGTPTNAVVGDIIVYTITVGNNGGASAANVTLTDTKPAFLDIVAITISPNPGLVPLIAGNTFTINFGTVAPTDLYTVTVLTRVNALGVPPGGANTVQIASTSGTDRLFNNVSAAGLTIGSTNTNTPSTSSAMPATGFAPNVVTDLMPQPNDLAYAATEVVLEIPSLGIKLPIVGVPKKNGAWDVTWLGEQAGWLEGTAFPSWDGNSVLTGHVYLSNGLPGPFINLGKMKYGDILIVHAYGQKYTFEVQTNTVVEPNDTSAFKHEEKPWLTLVTCKEYDEKTNTYKKRVVVRAVLVKAEAE